MNTGWVENPKQNNPPEMQLVEIRGCDSWGEWSMKAMKKTYVKPPHKNMKPGCWRWVDQEGKRLSDQHAEAWRPLEAIHGQNT